ncbi:MAG: transcription termination factor Rho [Gemmatimonadota bacterium]|jgi:transcription termination factor Rho|nr:transcription termination factor Rho [Gemmatimonadota bacterium]
MTERRGSRRGTRPRRGAAAESSDAAASETEATPYREDVEAPAPRAEAPPSPPAAPSEAAAAPPSMALPASPNGEGPAAPGEAGGRPEGGREFGRRNGRRRGRFRRDRDRERGERNGQSGQEGGGPPSAPLIVEGEIVGWFDPARDAGFVRRPQFSYLAEASDPFVPAHLARQYGLRRGDQLTVTWGRDPRGRPAVVELKAVNGTEPQAALRRPDFASLTASYPERKLTLETGRPAKGGPELTRRAIDLIAPIGFGQRALIVAPARAGKTMLLQAIVEGVAVNHPNADLLVLLVDERPEEVSEMVTWGYGEVVASSFDMPAVRHRDVVEMVLERAKRLCELGKDVVIVLDSITRMARAYNVVERGTGRTLSGGLDATAMAKPKAFFGSARNVAPQHGGGSITIISTALVETGSRMDDVIFEEFKGTGNCELKLDRSLAEKRIYPAIDIAASGTRREDKLFRPEQLEHVHMLRRGLSQMPPQAALEWLIKRIANTANNDALLEGL